MTGIDTFGFEDLEIRVYNPETKKVIDKFDNYNRAGYVLGISPRAVKHACETKGRKYSPTVKMDVAIRLVNKSKL